MGYYYKCETPRGDTGNHNNLWKDDATHTISIYLLVTCWDKPLVLGCLSAFLHTSSRSLFLLSHLGRRELAQVRLSSVGMTVDLRFQTPNLRWPLGRETALKSRSSTSRPFSCMIKAIASVPPPSLRIGICHLCERSSRTHTTAAGGRLDWEQSRQVQYVGRAEYVSSSISAASFHELQMHHMHMHLSEAPFQTVSISKAKHCIDNPSRPSDWLSSDSHLANCPMATSSPIQAVTSPSNPQLGISELMITFPLAWTKIPAVLAVRYVRERRHQPHPGSRRYSGGVIKGVRVGIRGNVDKAIEGGLGGLGRCMLGSVDLDRQAAGSGTRVGWGMDCVGDGLRGGADWVVKGRRYSRGFRPRLRNEILLLTILKLFFIREIITLVFIPINRNLRAQSSFGHDLVTTPIPTLTPTYTTLPQTPTQPITLTATFTPASSNSLSLSPSGSEISLIVTLAGSPQYQRPYYYHINPEYACGLSIKPSGHGKEGNSSEYATVLDISSSGHGMEEVISHPRQRPQPQPPVSSSISLARIPSQLSFYTKPIPEAMTIAMDLESPPSLSLPPSHPIPLAKRRKVSNLFGKYPFRLSFSLSGHRHPSQEDHIPPEDMNTSTGAISTIGSGSGLGDGDDDDDEALSPPVSPTTTDSPKSTTATVDSDGESKTKTFRLGLHLHDPDPCPHGKKVNDKTIDPGFPFHGPLPDHSIRDRDLGSASSDISLTHAVFKAHPGTLVTFSSVSEPELRTPMIGVNILSPGLPSPGTIEIIDSGEHASPRPSLGSMYFGANTEIVTDADYKSQKLAHRTRSLEERDRLLREGQSDGQVRQESTCSSSSTSSSAELFLYHVRESMEARRSRDEGREGESEGWARKCEYDVFVDEGLRGFIGDEPL
ncbi:uncharacterized protein BDR25DRAFT_393839 [Lindgomyces ingoldianus]|uniref:Uncharacterized protein n=1 Tax=Lindgomyces ingoldianus TaxID=673940 RepID=A0ACB6QTD2_9PLEO|nr:uncharacterized protein BDR25DRAFT_393839 [Lindgomyces ingoldianus]KAF2470284.1 hypothetical protein BDR25DRAFT_393839 [Lindgomyces ingoldianus]